MIRFVMLQCINRNANVDTCREIGVIHRYASRQNFAWQNTADTRTHAQRFIDTSTEVATFAEFTAAPDFLDVGESSANFVIQFNEYGRVVKDVKNSAGDCGGGGVGACIQGNQSQSDVDNNP